MARRDGDRRKFGGQAAIACGCGCIVGWVEFLSVAGTKRAIVDRSANLEQEIGPSSRPAHLLGFIHSAVHQKIGRPFGNGQKARNARI
jgi:hypothetical protein